ncbi:Gti1/Pac2 family-domain-containing protein [Schizophyllum fasciatum]
MSSVNAQDDHVPSYYGAVETTLDALRLVHAAAHGVVPRIRRRLNESERRAMIHSGAVFVFAVDESNIKRWTDGMLWSPSRIHKNFLVYREINERPQGRGNRRNYASEDPSTRSRGPPSPPDLLYTGFRNPALESTTFKLDGLHKKTITVTINDADWHLVAYYSTADIQNGVLKRPITRPDIMGPYMTPHAFRLTSFRIPPKIVMDADGRPVIAADDEDEDEHGAHCKSEEMSSQTSLFSPVLSPKNPFTGSSLYPIPNRSRVPESSSVPRRIPTSSSTPDFWSRSPSGMSLDAQPPWQPDMPAHSGRWNTASSSTSQSYDPYPTVDNPIGRPRSRTTGAPYHVPHLSSARGRQIQPPNDLPFDQPRYPTPGPPSIRSMSAGHSSLSWILDNPPQRSPGTQHQSPPPHHGSAIQTNPYSPRYDYHQSPPVSNDPLQWTARDSTTLLPLPSLSTPSSLHSLVSGRSGPPPALPPPFNVHENLHTMDDSEEYYHED